MPKTRQEKEVIINSLTQLFKDSPSVVFANYQGLTVPQVDELRDKMFESKIPYVVAKKTLINRAAKEAGFEINSKDFPGMLGLAFGTDDEVAPAKILGDMTKSTTLQLVGGLFNGSVVTQDYVVSLSKLPGRTQLYGMFLNVINGPTSGFVRALDAIRAKKEEAEGAPAPAPEAPKAEAEVAAAPAEEKPADSPSPEATESTEAPKAEETPADPPTPEATEGAEAPKE
ncbi:MAG: 50S ribosomal protein L10 [Patescibacteria group bacterium]|nr:50S ribosomal protein L10 [Patescibacteria group bacterium]